MSYESGVFLEDPRDPVSDRLNFKPLVHPKTFDWYIRQRMVLWTPQEITELGKDIADWNNKLSQDARRVYSRIFAYFSTSDVIVNENIFRNFLSEIKSIEAKMWYNQQKYVEDIHTQTYAAFLESIISDPNERNKLLRASVYDEAVAKKTEWAMRWINSDTATFGERVVAFAAVEGIHFSSSFASIDYLKHRGLMKGICRANDLIVKDEGLHRDFGCFEYSQLKYGKPDHERVLEIVISAVDAEHEFVREVFATPIPGMNAKTMCQYVCFVADHLLESMGFPAHYNLENPYPWTSLSGLEPVSNIFERPVEYEILGEDQNNEEDLCLDADPGEDLDIDGQ